MEHVTFGTVSVTVDQDDAGAEVVISGAPEHTEEDWEAACAYVAGLPLGVCRGSWDDEDRHIAWYEAPAIDLR